MDFHVFDGGKRVIGFQWATVTDRIELEGPSEAVEPETGPEPLVFERGEEPTVWVEDRTPVTASAAAQAARDLWIVCRRLCRELRITVPELLKLVAMCEKEHARHARMNRRLKVRAADMVE